ncbi:MAG: L-threonylcarbamoyladenylate synthase [Bacteroidia bacterium]|nr:L-threonylcarbamoyladenylate synthase [Bacteroidia bacterium]
MKPTNIGTDIFKAAEFLRNNETVAIPTETVYGLAANALNEEAVAKIFEVKNRPFFDPLIVHIKNVSQISLYARDVPNLALQLAEEFWPGPLTLVLKKQGIVPDLVTSGGDTVALRMPNNEMTLELLNKLDFPLAAPSANPFTYVSPTSAAHVLDQLDGKIPYILDGGNCQVGIESTIVRVLEDTIEILRPGGISEDALRDFLPDVNVVEFQEITSSPISAPGQLEHHYSPFCKLYPAEIYSQLNVSIDAVIYWSKDSKKKSNSTMEAFYLTEDGNFLEGSKNLFALLRRLDKENFNNVLFEWAPNENLGVAINDRLKRASAKRVSIIKD